ncbi:Rpn family recombination-promoting nuclease/putative transposase [Treponema sp. C6A8]|uniref:Rpn family recombination-promoting nuclease/putative transposase n=1 Tax=Treponema sp. C6A8 TaxID=1410609 RepID=UPI000684BC25|nr:Rpn family recombination-promoting nuclease/putative transposase [Treponema sp. C6A8]
MSEIKPIEELEYSDDFMFNQVMQDDKICIGVLERLLKIKIDHIERVELEKKIKPYYQSKGIRLDVYVKDSNRVFDLDMQSQNKDDLPRRLRYYQSMVDANALMKGEKYKNLKDSYIVFICKHDPVGKNLPVYSYLETCQEDNNILLGDGAHKFFFNAEAADQEKDVEIRTFLNYIKNGTAGDSFTKEIDSAVKTVKQKEAVKELYMFESLAIQDAMDEGERRKSVEAARAFYENGVSIELIAKSLKMTEEKVKEIVSVPVEEPSHI